MTNRRRLIIIAGSIVLALLGGVLVYWFAFASNANNEAKAEAAVSVDAYLSSMASPELETEELYSYLETINGKLRDSLSEEEGLALLEAASVQEAIALAPEDIQLEILDELKDLDANSSSYDFGDLNAAQSTALLLSSLGISEQMNALGESGEDLPTAIDAIKLGDDETSATLELDAIESGEIASNMLPQVLPQELSLKKIESKWLLSGEELLAHWESQMNDPEASVN